MVASRFRILAAVAAVVLGGYAQAQTNKPTVDTRKLTNGLSVLVVRFPASTNVSVFTFLPLGLASDNANQAQWSHLVEHLVIRSTIPTDSRQANAETLPDHMRLDFYGHTGNWQEGLSHHRRWLEGAVFTEASLDSEKPKVNHECDFTARNFATHKFALAAWSQGVRHGQTNVALKGDVLRAKLPEVQRLRDERLAVSNHVTLCVVGGLEPERVLAEVDKQFSALPLRGSLAAPVQTAQRNLDLTWDLNARHLLLTWPIPDFRQPDHAALMVAAQCLNQSLVLYNQLKGSAGSSFAAADLVTPEGSFFYVSTALRPRSSLDDVKKAVLNCVRQLSTDPAVASQASLVAGYLSRPIAEPPSLGEIKAQVPPGMDMAMVEANLGLQFGLNAHRYSAERATLARQVAGVTAADVQRVAEKFLSEKTLSVCSLKPAESK